MLKQGTKGFTLIELVAVIVILSILAVTVAPRLFNFKDDAKLVVFESLGSAIIRAANMAHYKQVASGLSPNDSIFVDGQEIEMLSGYPTDRSIGLLVETKGFRHDPQTGWFIWIPANSSNCCHDYNQVGWGGNPRPETGCGDYSN